MDKLELKSCHEVIDTVSVADVDSIFYGKPIDPDILTVVMKDGKRLYCDEVCPIDSLQEEPELSHSKVTKISDQDKPVSKDLEAAAKQYAKDYLFTAAPTRSLTDHFKAGANWQKQQTIDKASEWLKCAGKYHWYDPIEHNEGFSTDRLIEDFKKYMED